MLKRNLKLIISLLVMSMFSGQASAILINDAGVVGTIWTGTQSSSVANEIDWSNYLLGMGASSTITVDGNNPLDGATEDYATSSTDYNGIMTSGTQVGGSILTGWTSYEFVLGKYDGQNAGYILYNVADILAASGSSLPEFSSPIWGTGDQYQLSHWTGFNERTVPEPSVIALLAVGLIGIVATRRRFKA